jgi:uncharacterized membrane protein
MQPSSLRRYLDSLLDTYWFLPSLVTTGAIGLALLLIAVDRATSQTRPWLEWAYGGGADGARALLSAVAGSTITVVSVTFSVLVVALTVSSEHFGPRLLRTFMRDRPAQLVLGTFMGTFAYCLIVLRTVQGEGERLTWFVPHLAVAGAIALALVSVGALIYYVHHVATSMQVAEITKRLALDLERTIDRLYPDPIGDDPAPPERPPARPANARPVIARASGYVQYVDSDAVVDVATQHDAVVWLAARPGDFVVEGDVVAFIHARSGVNGAADDVWDVYTLGTDRTSQQDAGFAVQQLVEMALRALSPGMNEPFTAVNVVDRMSQGLAKLASRRVPSAVRIDQAGRARVVATPRTFSDLLREGFEPIALHAGRAPEVVFRLLERLGGLAAAVRREDDRAAIEQLAETLSRVTMQDLRDAHHRDAAHRAIQEIEDAFARTGTGHGTHEDQNGGSL